MNMRGGGLMLVGLIALGGCSRTPSTGPQGGDIISIKGGTAYAELLSNADTGQVMVETWNADMTGRRPIEHQPMTVGSGEHEVALMPYPAASDPAGTSSRFYGQADWVRGAGVRQGWMHDGSTAQRTEFEWRHGWEAAGRMNGGAWEEMGGGRPMGPGHGPGGRGGPMGH